MKSQENIVKKIVLTIIAICFWLFVWQFLSLKIDSSIFLPSPKETFLALEDVSKRVDFWQTVFNTFGKIAKGFGMAVICGTILAFISAFCKIIEILLSPVMKLIKAVPVASFIILALLWIKSGQLSVLISFIMVMPVIYINVLQGFENVDKDMLEMAKVFEISAMRKLRFIYLPSLMPGFIAACKIGLGFCFKSGIAAEVIGLPAKSIGSELYKSKLYLMTDELFAWTVVIVFMSVFFEGICIYLLNKLSVLFNKVNIVKRFTKEEKKIFSEKKNVTGEKVISEKTTNKESVNKELEISETKEAQYKSGKYKLNIENVSKSYGKQQVLNNITMTAENDEILCILGKSGLGKTTLLRIIAGLIKADAGRLKIITEDKNELKLSDVKVAMVFQEDRLIENTDIYTNLYCALGNAFNMTDVDKHLKKVGLEGLGYKKISELSGGMKRRVAIVRCIMRDSEILLLDEAFKGLDTILKENVIEYVKSYSKDKILILVTHDLSEGKKMGAKTVKLTEVETCRRSLLKL